MKRRVPSPARITYTGLLGIPLIGEGDDLSDIISVAVHEVGSRSARWRRARHRAKDRVESGGAPRKRLSDFTPSAEAHRLAAIVEKTRGTSKPFCPKAPR